jgi:hypothetical protein
VLTALAAGCVRPEPPARVEPPSDGAAVIGTAYGVTVSCPVPIELGGVWWTWDEPIGEWPDDISIPPFPFNIGHPVGIPYAVPGIVTLVDPDTAIFRADVDGSEFRLSAHTGNLTPGACL